MFFFVSLSRPYTLRFTGEVALCRYATVCRSVGYFEEKVKKCGYSFREKYV